MDDELDELMPELPAISIEGAKAIGKTTTAEPRASIVHRLDSPEEREIAVAAPERLLQGDGTILIDEYQRVSGTWDRVRRAVDDGAPPGRFLLTGSASSEEERHSGAARIVVARMRPLSILERRLSTPVVRLGALLAGGQPRIRGSCEVGLEDYVDEILRSGFPGIRDLGSRGRLLQLDGYVDRIVDRDVYEETGVKVRRPQALRAWIAAYAAATSTTTDFEKIRQAAVPGTGAPLSRKTAERHRDLLQRLWLLDPLPAWLPTRNKLSSLGASAKHHLADPALAARILGVGKDALLTSSPLPDAARRIPRDGTFLGALFESLVTLSVRVYAQRHDARTFHLRTRGGDHEVDLIVERDDGRIVALEVKLSQSVADKDVAHLRWLSEKLGDGLIDAVVVSTGSEAYRRSDGVAVVPAALLGA